MRSEKDGTGVSYSEACAILKYEKEEARREANFVCGFASTPKAKPAQPHTKQTTSGAREPSIAPSLSQSTANEEGDDEDGNSMMVAKDI